MRRRILTLAAGAMLASCATSEVLVVQTEPPISIEEANGALPSGYPFPQSEMVEDLIELVDAAIDNELGGSFGDPAPAEIRSEIFFVSTCLAFEFEREGASPADSMDALDRLFYRVVGNLKRHAVYLNYMQRAGFTPEALAPNDALNAECARTYSGPGPVYR